MKRRRPIIKPESPYGLKPDYDMRAEPGTQRVVAGANCFKMMKLKGEGFGKDFDYRVMDQEPGTNAGVWMPASKIAQHWLWNEVGETQHWIRLEGYNGLHVTDIEGFNKAAARDDLINEEDYMMSMEERDARAEE